MSEEKREEATPKAERRARERGKAWQSRDLVLAAVLGGAGLTLALGREALSTHLTQLMRAPLSAIESGQSPGDALLAIATEGMWIALPLLALVVVVAALASALQVGPLFAARAVEVDAARLDPSARLGELFGLRAGATLAMTLARLTLSSAIVVITLREALPGIATLARQTPSSAFDACVAVCSALLIRLGVAMAAIGALDAVIERVLYRRSLRMSRREVERERRESDGDEHVRRERDRVRSELLGHDVEVSVESARVVVEDGEIAVALAYDAADLEAVPHVVAVGRGLLGDRILETADRHRVKRVVDEQLAAELAIVPLGHPIPEALYAGVARTMLEPTRATP